MRKQNKLAKESPAFEQLERRQVLTGSASSVLSSSVAQEFSLVTEHEDSALVRLSNESNFTAEFTMHFNGGISVNLQDLVSQIRRSPIGGDVPDYEKAYYYLMEHHAHDFPLSGRTWMHEPSLYMNSLGAGLCDDAASALSLIWKGMGYESRIWLLSGHVVAEVHTGERWQMYDADLRVHYFNREGQIAGVEELAADAYLITTPENAVSDDPFVYSGRMSQIYGTLEDNSICTGCTSNTQERDLVFQIPAGGTIEWGGDVVDKELPTIVLKSPEQLGLLKVTIPAGSYGTLDIPLALYDVRGDADDSVRIANQWMDLGTDEDFEFFNEDTRQGNRIQSITYAGNERPIEVLYFFNASLAEIHSENSLEIEHRTSQPASVTAEIVDPVSTTWDFQAAARTASPTFSGTEYVDITGHEAHRLFDGADGFEIEARVQLSDEGDQQRRPVVDAYRFSVEIDSENRPYVYYRAANRWIGLRGPELNADQWHDLKVTYEDGLVELHVDGDLVGRKGGFEIDASYPSETLQIGKSEHLGGLYFNGQIDHVKITQQSDSPVESQVITVDEFELSSPNAKPDKSDTLSIDAAINSLFDRESDPGPASVETDLAFYLRYLSHSSSRSRNPFA